MKARILAALAATAAALSLSLVATGAQADTVATVTVHVKNRADNGHGTPATWAHDTWDRTATIETGDAAGVYTVALSGKGSFKTVKGAGEPSGSGATVQRKATGDFSESLTATVHGTPKGKRALGNLNGDTVGGKSKRAAAQAFIAKLFRKGAEVTTSAYTYTYETPCERWVDSNANNDGQADDAGQIVGKKCDPTTAPFVPSTMTAAPVCHVTPGTRERWTLTRTSDNDRKITAIGWIYYPRSKYDAAHGTDNARDGWTYLGDVSIAAGAKARTVTSPYGGGLAVHYWDGHGHMAKLWKTSSAKAVCH